MIRLVGKNPLLHAGGFIDGLRRGIGVHHAGALEFMYRTVVLLTE